MSNGILNAHLIGRFGNAMFQWAHAKKLAEQRGLELRTNAWPGQQIFEGVNEGPLCDEGERLPDDYRQRQSDLIYTRRDCRRWFRLNEAAQKWSSHFIPREICVAHRRVGDYAACGYVVVSRKSYEEAARKIMQKAIHFVTEESPFYCEGFPAPYAFMPDFLIMMKAKILLRGNSSFSWWAATLGGGHYLDSAVYSPVIDGLEGGKEQDCEFVKGNWPRLSNLDFTTDLHLKEE